MFAAAVVAIASPTLPALGTWQHMFACISPRHSDDSQLLLLLPIASLCLANICQLHTCMPHLMWYESCSVCHCALHPLLQSVTLASRCVMQGLRLGLAYVCTCLPQGVVLPAAACVQLQAKQPDYVGLLMPVFTLRPMQDAGQPVDNNLAATGSSGMRHKVAQVASQRIGVSARQVANCLQCHFR